MNVNLIKLLGGLTLFLCIVGFGLIPIFWHRFRTNKTLLSLSNCFSGGLFFAIGLIHILPEATETFNKTYKDPEEEHFPWSYFVCLSCFSFVLLIDKVLFNNVDDIESSKVDLHRSILNPDAKTDIEENFKELVSTNFKLALRMSQAHSLKSNRPSDAEVIQRPKIKVKVKDHSHDHESGEAHDHAHDAEEPHDHEEPIKE